MNYRKLLYLIISIVCNSHIAYSMKTGIFFVRNETRPGVQRGKSVKYAEECKNYVEGGVTFSHPANLFTDIPVVSATIEATTGTDESAIYAPCISANSTTSTTVIVNKNDGNGITEALNDEICVHLIAIEE